MIKNKIAGTLTITSLVLIISLAMIGAAGANHMENVKEPPKTNQKTEAKPTKDISMSKELPPATTKQKTIILTLIVIPGILIFFGTLFYITRR